MYGRQPAGSPEAPLSASSCLGRPRASESQLALALALSLTRSLSDLGGDPAARRATSDMIAEHGMRLILGLYSGWDDYEGPWTPSSPGAHVSQLEEQLKQER